MSSSNKELRNQGFGASLASGSTGDSGQEEKTPVAGASRPEPGTSGLSPLARAILAMEKMEAKLVAMERARTEPIAIIGMGCRFPGGASSPDAFWRLLEEGADAVTEVPRDRWPLPPPDASIEPRQRGERWGAFLEQVDRFDASFFGISPREASSLDPQQRLLIEVCWEALEHAGVIPDRLMSSRTGVFLGMMNDDYKALCAEADPGFRDAYIATGNGHCFAPGRISYLLGLQGPSLTIDTACSSSLVAIHVASLSLRSGDCSLALAGGVNLMLSPATTRMIGSTGALSPDGRCRSFDARANGYVRGEGCGVLVLKRLSDARADGDSILALIRGSAVNQDGRSTGMTTPNVRSQEALLRQALENARLVPSDVSYIETHGTGTPMGDPIELEALATVYGCSAEERAPCALGALKTQIGHLESAAGAAAVCKAILALKKGAIPPNLHFRHLNPRISLEGTPFFFPTRLTPWTRGDRPRVAGVSSFGMSGTNAHVLIEEAPARAVETSLAGGVDKAGEEESGARLVVLSARSEEALKGMAGELRGFLESPAGEGVEVSDVAYTRARHRSHLAYRLAVVAESRRELQAALADFQNGAGSGVVTRRPVRAGSRPSLVFVFSGQGSQMAGMGRGLQQEYPVFRHSLEHVSECLRRQTGLWLPEELSAPREQSRLHLTEVAQPALFAMQVSLVALLRNWGLEPDAVIGHSAGEVAAAYTSGALSLEGAVELVALRAKFMEEAARERGAGGMAVVALDEGRVKEALAGYETRVSVAAVNGPLSVVVSGERGALEEVLQGLEEKGERVRRLEGGYAFHSPQMEGAAERLAEALAGLKSEPLGRVMYSTVEGEEVRVGSLSGRYWGENVRGCVRFKAAVERAASEGERVFVEIGGHPVLRGDVEETLRAGGYEGEVVGTLRRGVEEGRALLEGVGRLYEQGVDPEWRGMNGAGGRRVSLPTYPWQRERYWLELGGEERSGDSEPVEERGGGRLLERGFEVATMPGVRFYEGGLSLERQPYLSGHGVGGAVVLPGAAYVRMLLEAGQEEYGAAEVELEEVRFERLLELEEGEERQVQVTLRAEEGRRARGEVYSRRGRGRGEAWERHASAVLVAYEGGSRRPGEPAIALEAVLGRCSRRESGEAYYARLSGLGLEYGGSFQCVREVWYGRGELVGRVELEAGEGRLEGEAYGVPPALLDGCLQLIGGLLGGAGGGAPVPVGAERIGLRVRGAGRLWVHVRKREEEGGEGGGLYDLQLREEGGEEVGRVDGLRVRRSERREGEEEERWRYELKWERREAEEGGRVGERLASGRRDGERKAGGSWLVLSDRGGCGSALVRTLERAGERGVRVMAGPEYRGLEADIYEVNPSRGEDLVRVLREVYGAGEVCRGVVHLWGLDVCDGEEGEDGGWESGGRAALEGLLHVVQGVVQRGWRDPPRLVVVTRGCQAVVAGERGEVWQSPLWGLGRVLRYEHPELGWLGVDLEAGGDGSESEALWEESRRDDGEDQVALRGGARFVARLTRAEGRRPASTGPAWKQEAGGTAASPVEGEGSYLITGGLGGLGLTVADWLVSQGARHLVLVSRREPDAGTQGLVEALRAQGAQVMVACADVSRVEDLAGVMARVESELPPLRGVVHAAGVLDDGLLVNQDSERFARVLAPKVQGAWNLHTVTRSQPLKWFVMFSSAASLLGSPGQASYAAGNAFLDALSVYRRSQGLPGMSIQWGPWAEVGMAAAEQRRGERLAHRGMSSIPTALALRLFDRLLIEHPPLAGIFSLDIAKWCVFHSSMAGAPLFEGLAPSQRRRRGTPGNLVLPGFLALPSGAQSREALGTHLKTLVAKLLRIPASKIFDETELSTLGFDSLMATELGMHLEDSLGTTIPAAVFWSAPTIGTLAKRIAAELGIPLEPAPPPSSPAPGSASAEDLVAMSDVEMAEMLAAELAAATRRRGGRP